MFDFGMFPSPPFFYWFCLKYFGSNLQKFYSCYSYLFQLHWPFISFPWGFGSELSLVPSAFNELLLMILFCIHKSFGGRKNTECRIRSAALSNKSSVNFLFFSPCLQDATVISHLMALLSRSRYTQEYICQIFSHCCKVRKTIHVLHATCVSGL